MALEGYTLGGQQAAQSPLIGYSLGGGGATLGGYTLGDGAQASNDGIISSVVKGFARDIGGGFNVASATVGEFQALMGLAAPMTWEDLSTRDIKGAMMLAALGVGGAVGGFARGLMPAGSSVLGRAGTLAAAEATAGAAMGMIRPLEEHEDRMRAVVGDAAFSGAFGAGLSFAKSGAKAVLSSRTAAVKRQASLVAQGKILQHQGSIDLVQQHAGVVLLNPTSGKRLAIRTLEDGTIQRTLIDSSGAVTEAAGSDFGNALAKAVETGYTDNLGVNRRQFVKSLTGKVDQATMDMLNESGGDVALALGPLQVEEYAAVRQVLRLKAEAAGELDSLAGEVLAPTGHLGVPRINDPNARNNLIKELGAKAADWSDGDLLREGFRRGLISADSASAGVKLNQYFRDLFLSDLAPDLDIVINPHLDAVGTSLLTPRRLAKHYPEFTPIYQRADLASAAEEEGKTIFEAWLSTLRQSVPMPVAKLGAQIIDENVVGDDLIASRAAAIATAEATGNKTLVEFVTQVTTKLDETLQRSGDMIEGRSGYFPMVVGNKWKLRVTGIEPEELAKTGTKLFYATRKEADAALAKLRAAGHKVTGTTSLQSMWHPEEVRGLGAAGAERLRQAYKGAFGPPPLKTTPFARQRTLGIRDFSEDPFQALAIYGSSTERAIAWRTFERETKPLLDVISPSQPKLKAAAQQYMDDMLGRPREIETTVQNWLEVAGYDPPPRVLKKYIAALRKWETTFRLGGPFSAIVNTTQVLTNTNAVLGPKWTASGMEVFMSRKQYWGAMERLHAAGYKLSHVMPFSHSDEMAGAFGVKAAFKEKRFVEAGHRMAMSLFNGAEKNNRLVTAWGAFKKAVSEGMDDKAAAAYAEEIVNRTQFIPRLSNTPELLRNPLGGLLLQFKSFVINEIEFIASLNKEEALRFGASVWGLGGLALFMNMPGTDIVDHASTFFFNQKISEAAAIRSKDASAVEMSFLYGLPGLMNVDMSDYIGVGTVSDVTRGLLGPAPKDAKHVIDFMVGAAKDFKSAGTISRQTYNNLIQTAGPSAVRRVLRGKEIFDTGEVRNPYTGKLVYKPERRLRAAIQQGIGFPELESTQERAAEMITTRVRDSYIKGRTQFAKQAAQAIRAGDSYESQRIISEAGNNGFDLDQKTVRYWVKELGRTGAERRERRTPKALRSEYTELFDATGTLELLP